MCCGLCITSLCPFQQRFLPTLMPILAKRNSPFSLTMFPALDQNPDWWTAPMTVTLVIAHTHRMLVPAVIQVCLNTFNTQQLLLMLTVYYIVSLHYSSY